MITSDEPIYNIKSVAQKTGIASTTLRAWERRYAVLKPGRTSGNYRLYSEKDVADLRWLRNQVEGGLSISRAVAALEQARQRKADAAAPLSDEAWRGLVAQLHHALLSHDEQAASEILAGAHPLGDACTRLITPALVQIGQGWHDGKVSIETEHFASQFLMGHLFGAFNALPHADGKLVVAGCAPKEFHQIGSLMLAVLLRNEGVNVRYLGADVPLEEWNDIIRTRHPAVVALSCSNTQFGHKLLMSLPFAEKNSHKHPKVVFGGMAFAGFANSYPDKPNIYVEQTLEDGLSRIMQLLEA